MDREIKFRGKRIDNGKWAYGHYISFKTEAPDHDYNLKNDTIGHYLFPFDQYDSGDHVEVMPETVGQFTGLKDKNGTDIYEGDIVRWIYEWVSYGPDGEGSVTKSAEYGGLVVFEMGQWRINGEVFPLFKTDYNTLTVIGNIHENPELLNSK